jgi:hypothetical protein
MPPPLIAVIYLAALVFLGIALAVVIDRSTRPQTCCPSAGTTRDPGHELLDRRLTHPQIAEVEEYYGRPFPAALRSLYENTELLLKKALEFRPPALHDADEWIVSRFLPADLASLQEIWFQIGSDHFPFAEDDFGNYFCVRMTTDADPRAVFYVDHHGTEVQEVAPTVEAFIEGLKPEGEVWPEA